MWLNKIQSLLLNLDVLAPSVQLRIAGNTSSKSFIGVLLFLGYVGVAIWTCLTAFADYRNTQNPRVTNDQKFVTEYQRFNLSESASIPIIIGSYLTRAYTTPSELEAFLTIKMWSIDYELDFQTGEYKEALTDIPFIPCKNLIQSGELVLGNLLGIPKAFLDIIPEYGMCANTTGVDVTVVGSNSDKYLQTVELSISPCSLPGGIGCKPAAEVNKMWIQTLTPRLGLDLSSQEDPVKRVFSPDDLFPLNVNNMQLFKYELVHNQIIDSFGFLTNDQVRKNFTTTMPRPIFWVPRDPNVTYAEKKDLFYLTTTPYVVIDWASGTKFNLIRRNYQGVIDLVSNIGGLNSIIWVIFSSLYYFLHPFFEKKELVKLVFGVQKEGLFNKTSSLVAKFKSAGKIFQSAKGASIATTENGPSQHITSNSTYTIVSKEVFDEAEDCINKELDVVNICKKLNQLQFLVELLLKREQTELIPLATLCRHTRRKNQKSGQLSRANQDRKLVTKRLARIHNSSPDMMGGIQPILQNEPKPQLGSDGITTIVTSKMTSNEKELDIAEPPIKGAVLTSVLEGLEEEFNKLIRSEMLDDPTETWQSELSPAVAKVALKAQLQRSSTKSGLDPATSQGQETETKSSRGPLIATTREVDPGTNLEEGVVVKALADDSSRPAKQLQPKPFKVVLRPNSNNSSNPIPGRSKSKGKKPSSSTQNPT